MSDAPVLDVIAAISPGDLRRYFAVKKVDRACPMCKEKSWAVHDFDDTRSVAWLAMNDQGQIPLGGKTLSVLLLSCNNCGTIWPLTRKTVEKWIKENPGNG